MLAALGALLVGLLAVVFLGTQVGSCLGPLGVTAIQCARASGIYPTVGLGLPVMALAIGAATGLAWPGVLRPIDRTAAAIVIGVFLGVVAYLALRPRTRTAAISTGEVITLELPLDVPAVVAAAVAGGLAAALIRKMRGSAA
jgi:hypothetical protein